MQEEGIVDAVWSDDGDTLMFGCSTLIRWHHDKTGKKIDTMIRVHEARDIIEKHKLDKAGLILFAMLSGGGYDVHGVRHCGPTTAIKAVKYGTLATQLYEALEADLWAWKMALLYFFRQPGIRSVEVPDDFPRFKHLENYREPRVSTVTELHNLNGLRKGWGRPVDQTKLRRFMRDYFNIWTRGFLKHITPVLLVRTSLATQPGELASNSRFELLPKQRKAKDDESVIERRVTYLPLPTATIVPTDEGLEDWEIFKGKDGSTYDPKERLQSSSILHFLTCLVGI